MNLMPNFAELSKLIPDLKTKPWVEYLDNISEGDDREKRFNQLLAVNFLIEDLKSGGTTLSRFLRDLDEWLDQVSPSNSYEEVVRAHIARNPREPQISFLKTLGKDIPMNQSPSLFELLVRASIKMKLRKRKPKQKVPHPKWLKGFAHILARDYRKLNPNVSASKIASKVNKELKRINPRLGTPDDVIRKMLNTLPKN